MPGPNGNRMPGGGELPAAAALLAGIRLVAVPCRAVNAGSGEIVKRVAPLNNIMASIRSQVLCAISSSFRVTALADMDDLEPERMHWVLSCAAKRLQVDQIYV